MEVHVHVMEVIKLETAHAEFLCERNFWPRIKCLYESDLTAMQFWALIVFNTSQY